VAYYYAVEYRLAQRHKLVLKQELNM